ncbi:RNA polymerase II-associated protein [Mycena floridula]|nr:RNA polymerase II-associated protein [Mycena floridula]
MSFKKSKLDLLVRVRYQNPLPAPPCPPKLLDIPTNPMRYARPEFLHNIATNAPLPMIVDAELGMPLDLSKWECLWDENGNILDLNPDIKNLPKLDPKDDWLANESFGTTGFSNGNASGASTPLQAVPWLRRTEYTSRSDSSNRSNALESRHVQMPAIDVSRPAQLRDIDASFAACNDNFNLSNLQHPLKPNVTALESYEVLPDADIWPNQYDLFKFSERPGERGLDVPDPRLDCAILRPMKSGHDTFLAYYLTEDDESAESFKESRLSLPAYEVPPDEEETVFRFVRDYETVKVEQEVPNEFLIVIDEGPPKHEVKDEGQSGVGATPASTRAKGAYYKNIERKMMLKKKRVNAYEEYDDKWELIRMGHMPMSQEEIEERDEALAEVVDPLFLMRGEADVDGDGEVEVEDTMQGIQ